MIYTNTHIAAYMYIVSDKQAIPCKFCAAAGGLWTECIVHPALLVGMGACAGCNYNDKTQRCNLDSGGMWAPPTNSSLDRLP